MKSNSFNKLSSMKGKSSTGKRHVNSEIKDLLSKKYAFQDKYENKYTDFDDDYRDDSYNEYDDYDDDYDSQGDYLPFNTDEIRPVVRDDYYRPKKSIYTQEHHQILEDLVPMVEYWLENNLHRIVSTTLSNYMSDKNNNFNNNNNYSQGMNYGQNYNSNYSSGFSRLVDDEVEAIINSKAPSLFYNDPYYNDFFPDDNTHSRPSVELTQEAQKYYNKGSHQYAEPSYKDYIKYINSQKRR